MKIDCLFPMLLLSLIFICANCTSGTEKTDVTGKVDFFDPIMLRSLNQEGNLFIEAMFAECGEWGGHREKITIYADSLRKHIYARHHLYPFDCDSLQHLTYAYHIKRKTPIAEKTILLDDQKKQAISDYLQRLTQSKVAESGLDVLRVGNLFWVVKFDSTLIIQVHDGEEETGAKSYQKLMVELFE